MTAQLHDVRAAMWTPGALAMLSMAVYVLASAIWFSEGQRATFTSASAIVPGWSCRAGS
jgi:hypothetical protein